MAFNLSKRFLRLAVAIVFISITGLFALSTINCNALFIEMGCK